MIDKMGYDQKVEALADACYPICPNLSRLSPSEYVRWSKEEEGCVVDVRSDRERAVSVVPGAVGREEFDAHIEEHRRKPICRVYVRGIPWDVLTPGYEAVC